MAFSVAGFAFICAILLDDGPEFVAIQSQHILPWILRGEIKRLIYRVVSFQTLFGSPEGVAGSNRDD